MPIYEYCCDRCGKTQDAVRKIDDRHDSPDCTRCNVPTNLIISPVRSNIPDWNMNYYDPGLGKYITSPKQLKNEREKLGVVDAREYNEGTDCPSLEAAPEPEKMKIPGDLYESMQREGHSDMLENVEIDQ